MTPIAVAEAATPWGALRAFASGRGLVAAWFPANAPAPEAAAEPRPDAGWAARLREAVDRFLETGEPPLPLDLSGHSAWAREVYGAVLAIPPGTHTTYGGIARELGKPRAALAVGAALGRQPWAFFLPTHRVWPATGGPGACRSGAGHLRVDLLRREGLLGGEGAPPPARPGAGRVSGNR